MKVRFSLWTFLICYLGRILHDGSAAEPQRVQDRIGYMPQKFGYFQHAQLTGIAPR